MGVTCASVQAFGSLGEQFLKTSGIQQHVNQWHVGHERVVARKSLSNIQNVKGLQQGGTAGEGKRDGESVRGQEGASAKRRRVSDDASDLKDKWEKVLVANTGEHVA